MTASARRPWLPHPARSRHLPPPWRLPRKGPGMPNPSPVRVRRSNDGGRGDESGGGMYRLVHFHVMWCVVPLIGSAISLLVVGAVRGFDEPFDNDTVFYLSCWAVGSAVFAFWPGRMSGVRAEARSARPLAPGTVLPTASTSLAHGAEWSFLTLPTVFSLLFGFFMRRLVDSLAGLRDGPRITRHRPVPACQGAPSGQGVLVRHHDARGRARSRGGRREVRSGLRRETWSGLR